jgi:hypothetical protein
MPGGSTSFTAPTGTTFNSIINGDTFYYVTVSNTTRIIAISMGTGVDQTLDIPSTLGGYSVTNIDYVTGSYYSSGSNPGSATNGGVFYASGSTITSIIIPNTVTNIGNYFFASLPDVTSITINNSSNMMTFGTGCFNSTADNKSVNIVFNNSANLLISAPLTFGPKSTPTSTFARMGTGSSITINNYTTTANFTESYTVSGSGQPTMVRPSYAGLLPPDTATSNITNNVVVPFLSETYSPPVAPTTNPLVLRVNYNSGTIYTLGGSSYPCFKEGSKILTNRGYVPIEKLRKGDLIKTVMNDYKAIDMIGKRDIYHPNQQERIKAQLYKCCQDKYPEVFEDLILTGCHCILIDDFTSDKQRQQTLDVNGDIYVTGNKYRLPACVDSRTTVYDKPGTYTIYHLALENDYYFKNYGIYANGLLVETCSKRYMKELSGMTLIE